MMHETRRVRAGAALIAVLLALAAFMLQESLPGRFRALMGIAAFILTAVACSSNVAAIRWRTVAWGIGLQMALAILILKLSVGGVRPGYALFSALAAVVTRFLEFTSVGAQFVFGVLADPAAMGERFPNGLVLAFSAFPIIIFASSVFTRALSPGRPAGGGAAAGARHDAADGHQRGRDASAAANVFMGQTEAPIIVRPYIARMTQSELLALMTGGLATIAGSMFAIYVSLAPIRWRC